MERDTLKLLDGKVSNDLHITYFGARMTDPKMFWNNSFHAILKTVNSIPMYFDIEPD